MTSNVFPYMQIYAWYNLSSKGCLVYKEGRKNNSKIPFKMFNFIILKQQYNEIRRDSFALGFYQSKSAGQDFSSGSCCDEFCEYFLYNFSFSVHLLQTNSLSLIHSFSRYVMNFHAAIGHLTWNAVINTLFKFEYLFN